MAIHMEAPVRAGAAVTIDRRAEPPEANAGAAVGADGRADSRPAFDRTSVRNLLSLPPKASRERPDSGRPVSARRCRELTSDAVALTAECEALVDAASEKRWEADPEVDEATSALLRRAVNAVGAAGVKEEASTKLMHALLTLAR